LSQLPSSIDDAIALLASQNYICGRGLGTVVHLALSLGKPLFLEGEAGVGKTEIAKALADALGRRLIRLQCYEGLDSASAIYEWNFAAQMVAIRTAEASGITDRQQLQQELLSDQYLIRRPLLQALEPHDEGAPVLLIDEIDRTDEPFEAYLLEVLSDFQVTIPELGVISADKPPIVVLTSNRTREVILRARLPEITQQLSAEIVAFVHALRSKDLFKSPGVAESIDWARCLIALDAIELSPDVITDTLGALLKYQDDIVRIAGAETTRVLDEAKKLQLKADHVPQA